MCIILFRLIALLSHQITQTGHKEYYYIFIWLVDVVFINMPYFGELS